MDRPRLINWSKPDSGQHASTTSFSRTTTSTTTSTTRASYFAVGTSPSAKKTPSTSTDPPPTERLTHGILDEEKGVFAHDWYARVHFPISQNVYVNRGGTLPRRPPVVNSRDIGPGIVRTAEKWKVTAARASHVQPYLESLAYRVDTASGKSIVFTGDTEPCDSVTDLARNADILVSNCGNNQSTLESQGLDHGQSGTIAAAQMAQTANVKTLLLTHLGPTFVTHGPLERGLGDIREHYSGNVIFAEELMKLEV